MPTTASSWTVAQSPNPGGWGNIVWGMSALTERNVWAVGVQATYTSNDPRPRAFAAGLFSNYDFNIYDGAYTLPQTLIMDTG